MVVTFIVSPDIRYCFQILDKKRLNKQALEAQQIIRVLLGLESGYMNHPAVSMWKGYVLTLKLYYNFCVLEWLNRGFNTTRQYYIIRPEYEFTEMMTNSFDESLSVTMNVAWPSWWSFGLLHLTHKCNLLRKLPEHYSQFFQLNPYECQFLGLGYYWPHKHVNSTETDWMKLCDPMGTGVPAQWRYKHHDIEKWVANGKKLDPITNKPLRSENGKLKVIRKAAIFYGFPV